MNLVPSRQEMFNRAVIGIRSQGWERCMDDGQCVYANDKGQHCAWGWVDQSLSDVRGSVGTLRSMGVGLAALLSLEDVDWANRLQDVHDRAAPSLAAFQRSGLLSMEGRFREFGKENGLIWPEEQPVGVCAGEEPTVAEEHHCNADSCFYPMACTQPK